MNWIPQYFHIQTFPQWDIFLQTPGDLQVWGQTLWGLLRLSCTAADRTQSQRLQLLHNADTDAFSRLPRFGTPVVTGTKPQVFPSLKAGFLSNKWMGTAYGELAMTHFTELMLHVWVGHWIILGLKSSSYCLCDGQLKGNCLRLFKRIFSLLICRNS